MPHKFHLYLIIIALYEKPFFLPAVAGESLIIVVVVVAVKAAVGATVAAAVGTVVVAAVDTVVVAAVDTVVVAAVVLNECAEQDSNGRCPSQGLNVQNYNKMFSFILSCYFVNSITIA